MTIEGNSFTSCPETVITFGPGSGFNVVRGNRFEWGGTACVFHSHSRNNILGHNIFDAHSGPAVVFQETAEQNIVDCNVFWRNGRGESGERSCHISFKSSARQRVTSNTFQRGGPDAGGPMFPEHAFVFDQCCVAANVLSEIPDEESCTSLVAILNKESSECISLQSGRYLQRNDSALTAEYLSTVNALLTDVVTIAIEGAITIEPDHKFDKILLYGNGKNTLTIHGSKKVLSFAGMNGVSCGSVIYQMAYGRQYASSVPSEDGTDGLFLFGRIIHVIGKGSYAIYVQERDDGRKNEWRKLNGS
jgi:hypothetical protein